MQRACPARHGGSLTFVRKAKGDFMTQHLSRRSFVTGSVVSAATGSIILNPSAVRCKAKPPKSTFNREMKKAKKRLDTQSVEQFVRVAHFDFDKVKQMLKAEPGLVNAVWDWGGGDFESALGAASHRGERDIALYLLDNGARPNLFTFAMLGQIDLLKSILNVMPEMIHTPGPHGIPLIAHAYFGGDEAQNVVTYLESKGAQLPSKLPSREALRKRDREKQRKNSNL